MIKFRKRYFTYLGMGLISALIATFYPFRREKAEVLKPSPRDYNDIRKSGILRVVTEYNSISYFAEADSINGFDYQLIKRFANDHNLSLEITPEMSYEKRLKGLSESEYDIIASPLSVNSELKDSLLLTVPLALNKQILVQRQAEENDSNYIFSLVQLAHKTVYVVNSSPAILRLQHLSNEIGDTIYIEEIDKYGCEQLLSLVAHHEIDYVVCEESVAEASADLFPQLDFNTPISFTQFYAWGVNKTSPTLLDSLNLWLNNIKETPFYKELYKIYY